MGTIVNTGGMRREVPVQEAAPPPLMEQVLAALYGDAPLEAELLQKIAAYGAEPARAEEAAALRASDWPNLGRYQASNAAIITSGLWPELVLMGDSISEMWVGAQPELFADGRVVGRGIGGQTSAQMLVRFYPDVIALRPASVHILCGTNDVAGNTGPTTPYRYQCNVRAMVDLAQASGIKVVLGLIPPAAAFIWRSDVDPKPWIAELNDWLSSFAATRAIPVIDYFSPLSDGNGGMRREFTHDGVHPTRRGYEQMRQAIAPIL